ncbi:glutamate receptor 2.8-like [Malania oleifera]|uniref:glutamate receptor 2.8-like n=1 Tax=Malania oleifera TaxID=397392 RepID=UPI0025AEB395|nr:glutamate receptor 2.8-like [Malania oleifera]
MPFLFTTVRTAPKAWFLFSRVISIVLILSHGLITPAESNNDEWHMNIGVIVDANSRSGKEETTAMLIAAQNFNKNASNNGKLFLHFRNSSGDPLKAASAADELIKEKDAQVIIGMDTWQEAALVGQVGNRAQVPVISFATASIAPPLSQLRWPFLVRMASNIKVEMRCIAAIVRSYGWRRLVVIYEDDAYSGDSGAVSLLSEALWEVGSEIECHLILPPVSSLSDPKEFVHERLEKLRTTKQSRVFIVLRSSLSLTAHLFREAKKMGLMGKDSAWIVTDAITSFLHSFNNAVHFSMNGALGTKTYYEKNDPFEDFSYQFQKIYRSEYLEEDKFEPGIHALRAYDSIITIAHAMKKLASNKSSNSKMLLQTILSSNFPGLSGKINFKLGELSEPPLFRIVNVIGNGYKELDFCSPKSGFLENLVIEGKEDGSRNAGGTTEMVTGLVNWPGDLNRVPKGWAMPTDAQPLKIGVPGRSSFENFVKVDRTKTASDQTKYSGFCIDIFGEVVKRLEKNYALPFEFSPFDGTYDALVDNVYNKTFDAVVGDVTILAERMELVEFTQPFSESGLWMIVPVKSESRKAWMFFKPFTWEMWLVTAAILIYTMIVVWFLEHRTNPDFRGQWKDQLGTALWFTFSSLFFAHGQRINGNLTRAVVVVWLFVVLILTSSYTASLSSMLTVQRLEPNVTDINWLRSSHQKVGCDGDSFLRKYLENVLHFSTHNIMNISAAYSYQAELKKRDIAAAFLEVPQGRAFLNQYCEGYTVTKPSYKFGGLAFVFQKGSPIAPDVSKAILDMSEDGTLKKLEEFWLSPTTVCSAAMNSTNNESLGLQSFWGLYVISGGTSTFCLLLFFVLLLKKFSRSQESSEGNLTPSDKSVWNRAKRLAQYFDEGNVKTPGRMTPAVAQSEVDEWEYVTAATPEQPQASHSDIEYIQPPP